MLGRFTNDTSRQVKRAIAALPIAQQLALRDMADRIPGFDRISTADLTKMYTNTVRAVYAASDDADQRAGLLESSAIGLALSLRLSN